MKLDVLMHLLLWSTIINYVIVILWWVVLLTPHQWLYNLCKRTGVTESAFDSYNFMGIIIYKILIMTFNLAPLLAILIVGPGYRALPWGP